MSECLYRPSPMFCKFVERGNIVGRILELELDYRGSSSSPGFRIFYAFEKPQIVQIEVHFVMGKCNENDHDDTFKSSRYLECG